MTRLTQNERIVRMLRSTGDRGITQLDVDAPTLDGGTPIRRLASRINELRDAGYVINTHARRNKMAVYRLESEPEQARPAAEPPSPASPPTPTPTPVASPGEPVASPANAIHGWDDDE